MSFVGWDIGFEPMYAGVTVRCVNHFANPTTDRDGLDTRKDEW